VLGQLSWEDEADGSLDLAGGHSGLLVVASQLGCLCGNLLEDVVDEGVQDGHGLGADSRVWVHLQQSCELGRAFFCLPKTVCRSYNFARPQFGFYLETLSAVQGTRSAVVVVSADLGHAV